MLRSIRTGAAICLGLVLAAASGADAKSALGIKNGKVSVTSSLGDESFRYVRNWSCRAAQR